MPHPTTPRPHRPSSAPPSAFPALARAPLPTRGAHSGGRRRPRAGGLALALIGTLTFLGVGGSLVAGADPGPPMSESAGPGSSPCPDLLQRYAPELPTGWTMECASAFPAEWPQSSAGASAMSDRRAHRIVVLDGQSPAYTEASLAHEIAHAEASSWPSQLRADVAAALGTTRWADGGPASPMEVVAESSVGCRGLPTHASFPLIPCDVLESYRTAGGATTPLPTAHPAPPS